MIFLDLDWDLGFGIFSGNVKLEHSEIPPVIFCKLNEMNEHRKSGAGEKVFSVNEKRRTGNVAAKPLIGLTI